jgi:hypothetical protein
VGLLVDSPARRPWIDSKEGQRLFKLHCVCMAIVGFGARHRSRTAAKAGRCSSRTSSRQPAALVVDASTRPLNNLCRRIPSFHTSPLSPIIPAVKSPGVICRLSPVATSVRERIPTSMIFTTGLSHAWRRDTITLLEIQIAVYNVQPVGACGSTKICYPQPPKVFGDNVNVSPRMHSVHAPRCYPAAKQWLPRNPPRALAECPVSPRASPEIIFDASTRSEIFSRTRYVTVS